MSEACGSLFGMELPSLIAALLIGIAVGAAAIWFVTRAHSEADAARTAALRAQLDAALRERDGAISRADEALADREGLVSEFKALSFDTLAQQGRRADETAEVRLRATEQLLTPVRDGLDRLNLRLTEVEKQRAALGAELGEQVRAVRRTGDELRRETAALATALRKPHVRGAWGELQLKRVAEVAGMVEHCDFVTQETAVSSEERTIRPDMKVHLGEGRFVYVDSKVPLAAFLDAQEAVDERARDERLQAFARNVRGHIDALSSKNYFKAAPATPEFVVLFLPSEALAAEALSLLPDLHEYAARRNIVLATPTTLIAMLRAVAYGWKQAALADSAAEVFALGRELYDRLGTLGGHVDRLGRSLNGAVKAYNVALGSLETRVLVTGRRLRDLKVSEAELTSPSPCEELARPVTAPELVTDDGQVTPLTGRRRLGSSGREAPGLPEAAELVRPEPDLLEMVEMVESVTTPVQQGKMAR